MDFYNGTNNEEKGFKNMKEVNQEIKNIEDRYNMISRSTDILSALFIVCVTIWFCVATICITARSIQQASYRHELTVIEMDSTKATNKRNVK